MATTKDEVVIELVAQTQKALGGIKKLGLAVGAVVATVKSFEVVAKQVFESAMLANRLEDQSIAFEQLAKSAGVASDDILKAMQEMTKGTISRIDLMKTASQASLLGIGFTEMPKLLEIARAAAIATGQDMSFMFESIVTGVGRASPLILDNLGIVLKVGEANKNYAEELGKTVQELTSAEKKQAILNQTLISGEEIIKNVGTAVDGMTNTEGVEALKVAFEEFRTELGQNVAPATNKVVEALTKIINLGRERLTGMNEYTDAIALVNKLEDERFRRTVSMAEVDKARKIIAENLAKSTAAVAVHMEKYGDVSERLLRSDHLLWITHQNMKKLRDTGLRDMQRQINLLNEVYGILENSKRVQEEQGVSVSNTLEDEEKQNEVLGNTLELLNGIKTTYGTLLGSLLPEGFKNTFIFDEPMTEEYWQTIEDRYKWLEKAEFDFQRSKSILAGIAHEEQVKQLEEIKQGWQSFFDTLSSGALADGVSAFREMGIAISQGKDITDAFARSILNAVSDAMQLLAVELAIAGAKQIGMGNVPLGLGMITAAAGVGLVGGALSGISSSASGSSPVSASSTLSTSFQKRSQPARSIIINNTTVSGSYIASRNVGMRVT